MEDDVGNVFFFSMELDAATREIVIECERHDRFTCRIRRRDRAQAAVRIVEAP